MKIKKCSKCGVVKDVNMFHKDKYTPDGLKNKCKECCKDYYALNKEHMLQKQNEYYNNNKQKCSDSGKRSYMKNRDKILLQHKMWKQNNPDKVKALTDKWNALNKDKRREWYKNRMANDDVYKAQVLIRDNIVKSFKKTKHRKTSKTKEILGCEWDFFRQYIEAQFKKGMTWENHGEWHLDHIYPVSKCFTKEAVINSNHYTNFQPLWRKENRLKSNKIIEGIQRRLL